MKFSIITASKSYTDPKLQQLKNSIMTQEFCGDVEHIVVTEGDPESAKAIGIKRATGDIVCIVASDCSFPHKNTFSKVATMFEYFKGLTGCYSFYYHYDPTDPILNRYFALFGFNDPIPFYLGKCDRHPHYINQDRGLWDFKSFPDKIPTLGDNGFFIKKETLMKADIKNYSHIDICEDLRKKGLYNYGLMFEDIHHKTGDSLWGWIRKRFYYADTLQKNRRWHMVTLGDVPRLIFFVLLSLTFVEPCVRSIYGYLKSGIKDKAWFLHPIICFITIFVYGGLCVKLAIKRT